jgi:hypothetical protein
MQKELLSVSGLFSRTADLDTEFLPPPPPFPDIEPEKPRAKEKAQKIKKEKTKIVLRHKESVSDILSQTQHHKGEPEDFMSLRLPTEVVSVDELIQDGDEISGAIDNAKNPKRTGFWGKLFAVKTKTTNEAPTLGGSRLDASDDIMVEEIEEGGQKAQTPIQGVMKKIKVARQQLENLNVKGAKETYVDIMKLYRMMTQDEQQQVYEIIQELYEERKAAEKMPNVR